MGHWGWRRLLAVFVSVWVTACSTAHDTAPTAPPTAQPQVTLTARMPIAPTPSHTITLPQTTAPPGSPTPFVYMVQAGDTLVTLALRFGIPLVDLQAANRALDPLTLPVGEVLVIPNPRFDQLGAPILPTSTPLPIQIMPPTCYDTPTDSILCLGYVFNQADVAVERVGLWVRLYQADGNPLGEAPTSVEQGLIPPGMLAPYRLVIKAHWRDYAGSKVTLLSADAAPDAAAVLIIEDQQGWWITGRTYRFSGTLHNPETHNVHVLRAVVTLRNQKDQITGYRVVQLNNSLPPNERLRLDVNVNPQILDRDITPIIYIEAVHDQPESALSSTAP